MVITPFFDWVIIRSLAVANQSCNVPFMNYGGMFQADTTVWPVPWSDMVTVGPQYSAVAQKFFVTVPVEMRMSNQNAPTLVSRVHTLDSKDRHCIICVHTHTC